MQQTLEETAHISASEEQQQQQQAQLQNQRVEGRTQAAEYEGNHKTIESFSSEPTITREFLWENTYRKIAKISFVIIIVLSVVYVLWFLLSSYWEGNSSSIEGAPDFEIEISADDLSASTSTPANIINKLITEKLSSAATEVVSSPLLPERMTLSKQFPNLYSEEELLNMLREIRT